MQNLSVSQLTYQISSLLETTFLNISVEGEISGLTKHNSGHWYFSLKDENAVIKCVFFRGNNQKVKFDVQEGMSVLINAKLSVYPPHGTYQLNCVSMQPVGIGSLTLAFNQLKEKLEKKGYFEKSIKKTITKFPKSVGILTSFSGAALQDMLKIAKNRYPLCKFYIYEVLVQGEGAKESIVKALRYANKQSHDCLVLSRGGGSIEDLWVFNEEIIADEIYKCKIPIISAIGHESDFLISDYVADLRAATPSNAMELLLPDINNLRQNVIELWQNFDFLMQKKIKEKQENINFQKNFYKQYSFMIANQNKKNEINNLINTYNSMFKNFSQNIHENLNYTKIQINQTMKIFLDKQKLKLNNQEELSKSFEILINERKNKIYIEKNGQSIKLKNLKKDDKITIKDTQSQINAIVI